MPQPDEPVRKIIHVDMDAFYASVEQRDEPSLRGRPVAVGGMGQRGVVAAASYEARRFGIRSAMPSTTARRLCKELVFVAPRFEVYRQVSRQIHAIFADYTDLIEPLSLDEAYLDVTENRRAIASATWIAQEIRARIRDETGLTASAGVSYNKFLAKLASDYRKPDGLWVITPVQGPRFVQEIEIGRFHGIGPVTAGRMKALGIHTGADLARMSLETLRRHFGKAAEYYHGAARGVDHREVRADRERKSVGAETTFPVDLVFAAEMRESLAPTVETVWAHCAKNGLRGRTVTVKVKYADFQTVTRSRTLAAPMTEQRVLDETALALLEMLLPPRKGVRLLGVSVSNFGRAAEQQLHLFG